MFREVMANDITKRVLIKLAGDPVTDLESPSYTRSFLGGLDPTGITTFNTGLSEHNVYRRPMHTAMGVLGGIIGGVGLLPATLSSGISLFNKRKRFSGLSDIARTAWNGAKSPFVTLRDASRLSRVLRRKELTAEDLDSILKLSKSVGSLPEGFIRGIRSLKKSYNTGAGELKNVIKFPEAPVLKKIRKDIASNNDYIRNRAMAAMALAGGVGGASTYGQFESGSAAGDRIRALNYTR